MDLLVVPLRQRDSLVLRCLAIEFDLMDSMFLSHMSTPFCSLSPAPLFLC